VTGGESSRETREQRRHIQKFVWVLDGLFSAPHSKGSFNIQDSIFKIQKATFFCTPVLRFAQACRLVSRQAGKPASYQLVSRDAGALGKAKPKPLLFLRELRGFV
jgi:hypothetical protein